MFVNYHLIPYNFEEYNFEAFREEEKVCKGEVRWQYGTRIHKLNKGDICFFYCTRLPDMTNRILLRAVVSETECTDDKGNTCFKIRNISAIRLKEAESSKDDDIKYGFKNLKFIYKVGTVRGKQKLDVDGKHSKLIADLESEPRGENLNQVKKYYEGMTKCVFERHDHNPKIHRSFVKPNGFTYFETHHVIQQNMFKNNQIPQEVIENSSNKVYLCPTCHRKIHYGKKEDVREMLESLYHRTKETKRFFERCFTEYATDDKAANALNWLFNIYNAADKS